MGILSRSGVGALPRRGMPLLTALMLAGNIAIIRNTRQRPASSLAAGISRPTAPKPCRIPVRLTKSPGFGNALGTMATRSLLVLVKWALAVNANIAVMAQRAQPTKQHQRRQKHHQNGHKPWLLLTLSCVETPDFPCLRDLL